jgi:flagellar hook-associated protein 1 FlgK
MTTAGHTLVDNDVAFRLEIQGPKVDKYPRTQGVVPTDLHFSGTSYNEYTIEIVTGGTTGDGIAQFRVSLDGGRTWLRDAQGNELRFDCNDDANRIDIFGLGISFAAGTMSAGDRYVVTPKSAVYWVTPTSDPMNISPQIFADGTENTRRMTGGSLAGYLAFRDYNIGQYQEMLNNYARSIIWEVNHLHSQGVGLDKNFLMQGEYQVQGVGIPLGANSSGLIFHDRLQSGNVTFYAFDEANNELVPGAYGPLDFGGGANFDPTVHTLEDVRDAINGSFGTYVTASIINNQLTITANAGYTFAVGDDTAGLLAALGLNTFFSGDSSSSIGINSAIVQDLRKINAGNINGGFEGNMGDNSTAQAIAALATKRITVAGTSRSAPYTGTLSGYYSTIVSRVGTDTATARFNGILQRTMALDLDDRQQALSGVNLDEEMANLIKFQNSYKAAAKLISTADQMFQTLLGLKQ